MRASYNRASSLLQSSVNDPPTEYQVKAALKRQVLCVAGFKEKKIVELLLDEITDAEPQSIVRQTFGYYVKQWLKTEGNSSK